MQKSSYLTKIAFIQNLGFLAILVLCYLDELLRLPALVFSDHPFDFRRPTLEMLLFLAVWLLVNNSMHRLLKRIRQLEEFMRVCAWCRRIDYRGQWITLEKFMEQGFDTPTTHGICPECLREQEEAIRRKREARRNAAATGIVGPQEPPAPTSGS
jgi:hypothetical protein